MRSTVLLLLCATLAGCAGPQAAYEPPERLFHDPLFGAPPRPAGATEVFTLSDAMRAFLERPEIAHQLRRDGAVSGLIEALYTRSQLKLQYDDSATRNASQAFDDRAGNCLSLVIMTSAFAKELGLSVEYRSAYLEPIWIRLGSLMLESRHINITLVPRASEAHWGATPSAMTVDFLPGEDLRRLRTREISERTVVAMYMNNRAAEALVEGDLDQAYAWLREAAAQDPQLADTYVALGVVYKRHGDLAAAQAALQYVLQREPENTMAMSNLASVLSSAGDETGAQALRARLEQLVPDPPYHYFDLGMQALREENFPGAQRLFAKEVARADYNAEFHFWLAIADFRLGDAREAREQMKRALETSTRHRDHELYAAKLAWLRERERARQPAQPPASE